MNILYICTHNRCRSILSEAITRQKAQGVINAQSAGSQPVGEVHSLSLRYLQESGYGIEGLRSKSWENLSDEHGHDFIPDVIITVCDQAAGESCPLWLGKTPKLHWGLSDPSKLDGTDAQKREAFLATIHEIEQRVDKLMAIAKLDKDQQLAALTQLTQAF
jgi:arsenate reductase